MNVPVLAQDVWTHYNSGDYELSIAASEKAIGDDFINDESWPICKAKSELALGLYEEAAETINKGLEEFKNSVRIRLVGIEVAQRNDQPQLARAFRDDIERLWDRSAWRYRGPLNQIAIAHLMLDKRTDAKEVLSKILNPVKNDNQNLPEVYMAIGQLALQKHDKPYAAENFAKAAALDPMNPDAHFQLAMAYQDGDPEQATKSLNTALSLNPKHAPSLLAQIDQLISRESYDEAEEAVESLLKINSRLPEAWAYRAAIAHLTNQPKQEGEYRNRALSSWKSNPNVDFLIGKKLSQKYRFKEAVKYQRRSLVYDPNFLPAKMQLAHDLLRVGNELEGWKVADEVFDADPYSVVAFNLVTLRDNLSEFDTIQSDGFIIRMSKEESAVYGQHVVQLLRDAKKTLTEKYQIELETPIFIEIFPQQSDFAIRTFGLPGGAGFLGVCFGRVVTMNSPAAQGSSLTNWQSVLWHEFCHVVTLQKTKNRMPRWLSEGISVYEERQKNPAWGQSMNPRYRAMILGEDHTPISKLSSAFLTPKSAVHLDFAYFEASLAVEFLISEFGADSLQKVLTALGIGIPINDALRRYTEPLNSLDQKFKSFVVRRSTEFAKEADLENVKPESESNLGIWVAFVESKPNNRSALIGLALEQNKTGQFKASNETVERLLKIYPNAGGIEPAYTVQAANYRKLNEPENELNALKTLVSIDASNTLACTRILELTTQAEDWAATKKYARELMAIDPLIKTPHRYLALAAEKTNDDLALIQSLRSLAQMDPLDAADTHFRLAAALHREKQWKLAKRHTLIALEFAPRFRDAHQLLLRVTKDQKQAEDDSSPKEDSIFDLPDF